MYTSHEVAKMFGCNFRSVIRWVKWGWLKATKNEKNGRYVFSKEDIEEFRNGAYKERWASKRKDYVPK